MSFILTAAKSTARKMPIIDWHLVTLNNLHPRACLSNGQQFAVKTTLKDQQAPNKPSLFFMLVIFKSMTVAA